MDDNLKLEAITQLRVLHRSCGHWLTVSSIAEALSISVPNAKALVMEMLVDGWLNVRDADKKNQWLAIQLKPEYRR